MSEKTFKPGDAVWLKSGGPEMTISHVNLDKTYHCIWVEKNKKYEANFPEIVLRDARDFS